MHKCDEAMFAFGFQWVMQQRPAALPTLIMSFKQKPNPPHLPQLSWQKGLKDKQTSKKLKQPSRDQLSIISGIRRLRHAGKCGNGMKMRVNVGVGLLNQPLKHVFNMVRTDLHVQSA